MAFEKYIRDKRAFIFELDDVIFPQKDYLLQVYYLFAQFMEYSEQINAEAMIKFMQEIYQNEGAEAVFGKTVVKFAIPEKYRLNFDLLLLSARLPLKLLVFSEMLKFIQEVVMERKLIFLFTNGDPAMQLNKIRQTDWHGLEQYLEVHFAAESASKPSAKGLQPMIEKYKLKRSEILLIGKHDADRLCAKNSGIEFLNVDKLLLP
jgi:FMN phosphatase YigB (HAD superfamily)